MKHATNHIQQRYQQAKPTLVKTRIYSEKFLIGTTELIVGDKSMGNLFGEFEPTELYFEKVQKKVWEFWKTNKPNYEKWNSLRFNAQLENGVFLFPEGGYTFSDVKELTDEPIRIDLTGIDYTIIENYFVTKSQKPFVEKPWNEIGIEQKIAFENELNIELGNSDKFLLKIFERKSKKKLLSKMEFSAFCHDQRNDDVLFEIRQKTGNEKFMISHLTWSGKKEQEGYPKTEFFKDFNEFKIRKMNLDKIDYEY
ncbi:hypothetical protein [Tenacibaculum finnmarkense]|uniref:hypothetical protein n=1 Tax=Tenacibaculum finnmarkense TaxID=2781243 RepID=UPI001EFAF2D9|nr:hypothetical protein [Tenacibaculum finnmarkense]MCG8796621.1 hypothetical protein [Tenacibaculum finnmarkense]MCG8798955.1 hypothetical protein [Tenacibaculum finnmarkense]